MSARVTVRDVPGHGAALARLEALSALRRLWDRDASLWSEAPQVQAAIRERLGWLDAPERFEKEVPKIEARAGALLDGIDTVVLLGMGGSSLCPELFATTFGPRGAGRPLWVIDSTDPDIVAAVEAQLALERTLFVVASKSGGTIETRSLHAAFDARSGGASRFVAITDPGSPLVALAQERGFAACFENPPDIGGRFSALSAFGLVPAALLGLDLSALLASARAQAEADGPSISPAESPAARLAAALAAAWEAGRDKLTLRCPQALEPLAEWVEQLVAESTGKEGKGIVPITREPPDLPAGDDRLFVEVHLEGLSPPAPAPAGAPLVTVTLPALEAVGAAFFLWEVATALCGALMGINPFDEPDVRSAKERTARLLERHAQTGEVPRPAPRLVADGFALTGDAGLDLEGQRSVAGALEAHLGRARPGDYLCLQAFLPASPEVQGALRALRERLARRAGVASTLGIGPRYLHASGQLHKGGPNRGLFVQLTHTPRSRLEIPGATYDFRTLLAAQAGGDLSALLDLRRRVLAIDLGDRPIVSALERLGGS